MPLVSSLTLLHSAQIGGYAVGAFNVENMEMVQGVLEAAEQEQAPVLLQTTGGTLKYAAPDVFRNLVATLAGKISVPVALHLDHGGSLDMCRMAMDAGYTSIMIDGSKLPFEANIAVTAQVVEAASHNRVPVEAELGAVGGKEDDHHAETIAYTDPEEARTFVMRTGIQSLAVAIGTAHGFYRGEPHLDFDRLQRIRERVQVPLVLHGASGLADETVCKAVSLGICKVNFATELRDVYTRAVREVLTDGSVFDPKVYGMAGRQRVRELTAHKMRVCGCSGKAG